LSTSDGVGGQIPAQGRPAQPDWRPEEDLWPLEEEMVTGAAAGNPVGRGEGPFTLAEMQAWAKERTVRAEVLRHLLIAGQWPVDATGVRLHGVRISGLLNLEAAALRCPLMLDRCYLDADKPACFDYAVASRLTLTGCQLAGLTGETLTARALNLSRSTLSASLRLRAADITGPLDCSGARLTGIDNDGDALVADWMKVGGGVFLRGGFSAAGAVRLPGAYITGPLNCSGAQLTGTGNDGDALVADWMKVSGGVFLSEGCTVAGAVRLRGAYITGPLDCSGARLTGTGNDGNALVADGMKVSGDVFLDGEFTSSRAVRLPRADITGQLSCRGARLTGTDHHGDALVADGMKVGGGAFLRGGFTAAGAVRLPDADITGPLDCRGARLTGTIGNALVADGMKVSGDVFLSEGFTASGTISLPSAHIGASVHLKPTALAGGNEVALNAQRTQIAGTLEWAPAGPGSGRVNLEGATVGQLDDDWSSERPNGCWPTGGRLRLDGFTYRRFGGTQQATAKQRLDWIRSQYQPPARDDSTADFATQPYEQLAAVYRQAGLDTEARDVAIARRADLRTYGNLNRYRRFGNWFLDWSIGYGYKTWRAALKLAAVFVVFAALSFLAQHHHLMVPVGDTEGLHPAPSATKCTSSYPCFYAVGYALDTVIPIINVHQAENWGPYGQVPWGRAWVAGTWIATGLGWALATLLVAGYTGLVRRD
jgi:hypothetical protein